jgi:hypothetical protein
VKDGYGDTGKRSLEKERRYIKGGKTARKVTQRGLAIKVKTKI